MTYPMFFFIVAVPVAALAVWFYSYIPCRERREYFQSREPIDFNEWYDKYYSGSGISEKIAYGIAEVLADEIGCLPTQLLPSDEIEGNLSLSSHSLCFDDSFEIADLALESTLAEWGIHRPLDNTNWHTLDDVIRSADAAVKAINTA